MLETLFAASSLTPEWKYASSQRHAVSSPCVSRMAYSASSKGAPASAPAASSMWKQRQQPDITLSLRNVVGSPCTPATRIDLTSSG